MKLCMKRLGQHWRQRCSSRGLDFELRGTLLVSHPSLSMNRRLTSGWNFPALKVQHTGLSLMF